MITETIPSALVPAAEARGFRVVPALTTTLRLLRPDDVVVIGRAPLPGESAEAVLAALRPLWRQAGLLKAARNRASGIRDQGKRNGR